jgi:Ca2+-binding RTX toxin-like protein
VAYINSDSAFVQTSLNFSYPAFAAVGERYFEDSTDLYAFEDKWCELFYLDEWSVVNIFGRSITTGNANQITGGTVEYVEIGTWNDVLEDYSYYFWIDGLSIGAKALFDALYSPSTADERQILDALLSGDDVFYLSNYDDVALSQGGNDVLWGFDGNDVLDGGAGNDVIHGGDGNDTLTGGADLDTLAGGSGDDSYVTDGSDKIIEHANHGSDTVYSSGTCTLAVNVENLVLSGSGNINGTGNRGDNFITGTSGKNTLRGERGADSLAGNGGDDVLIGGAGRDTLSGGNGRDTFTFAAVSDSGRTQLQADVISDFARGQDKINLRDIDAFAGSGANDTFTWRGGAAFSSLTQGEVRFQKFDLAGAANDHTMVWVDNDADIDVEMAIRLTGLHDLTASDFVL